jgi:hypothetical protein
MNPEKEHPGQAGTCTGASTETGCRENSAAPADLQAILHAASQSLRVMELEVQAFGTSDSWGTHARPGKIAARVRSLKFLARASFRAMEIRPALELRHIVAALRSLLIEPRDLLVCHSSGDWLSTKEAVAHRGREVAKALAELALIVKEAEEAALEA